MRTIVEKTRSTMLGNKLEEKLWAEIMSTIVYLTNRASNKSTTSEYTSYEF